MPAATPKPTLDELLIILSRCTGLRANFVGEFGATTDHGTVELCFKFKREHLGPAAEFVFSYPSSIFPALKEMLEYDDVIEKAYRSDDPRNTIEDVIGFLQQKRAYNRGGSLEAKLDAAFLDSALKYLRELDRRRYEADRRAKEAAEARRKRDEEEIAARVREEILRREQERQRAKAEAHQRWEEGEAEKRKWQQNKTSDSGFDRKDKRGFHNPFEDMFRDAGIDPNDPIFEQAFRRASFGYGFGRNPYEGGFDSPFGRRQERRSSPPPPPGGKRPWYDVLGCPPGANRDEIRAAAREKAKGLHPDKSSDPKAKEKFQEISQAKAEGLAGCV